jgi:phosphoenolpyruvate carboxykinase (ATP)
MRLPYTRAMLTAALEGQLDNMPMEPDPFFKTMVPRACPHVPPDFLDPRGMWGDKTAYDRAALELSGQFSKNFEKFPDAGAEILEAGPVALARV